jgi:cell division protease FtsH
MLAEEETIDGDLFRKIVDENIQTQVRDENLVVSR